MNLNDSVNEPNDGLRSFLRIPDSATITRSRYAAWHDANGAHQMDMHTMARGIMSAHLQRWEAAWRVVSTMDKSNSRERN
jgi:hypothetical protein